MSDVSRQRLKWLTLAYASTLLILIAVADRGALAIRWLAHLPAGDKLGHFVLFGLMSLLANAALGDARLRWRAFCARKGSMVVGAAVILEEVSQLWLSHRAFELADLAADCAGIWIFGLLAARVVPSRRLTRSSAPQSHVLH